MFRSVLLCLMLTSAAAAEPDPRCGAYCLYVALRAVDVPIPGLADLERQLGPPSSAGYSLGQLEGAARTLGARTLAVTTTLERLSWRPSRFSVIAHLNGSHFVVLTSAVHGRVTYIDVPTLQATTPEALLSSWSGVALLVSREPLAPEESLQAPWSWRRTLGWIALVVGAGGIAAGLLRRWGRRRTAALLLALIALPGCGGEPPLPTPRGRLRLTPRVRDLGVIPMSANQPQVSFAVENVGDADLTLKHIDTACSCVIPQTPPGTLRPGEAGTIQVRVNPLKVGPGRTSFTLLSSDELQPRVVVQLTWDAQSRFQTMPEILDFGAVAPGAAAELPVRVSSNNLDSRLAGLVCHPKDALQADLAPSEGGWNLKLQLTAGRHTGVAHGFVWITTNDPEHPRLELPVHWNVRDVIAALPPRLPLGSVPVGRAVEKRVRFQSSRGPLRVTGARVEGLPDATIDVRGQQELPEVVLNWIAAGDPRLFTGSLTIECTAPEAMTVTVPLSGQVTAAEADEPVSRSEIPVPEVP